MAERWTPQEDQVLKENFENKQMSELKKLLNREWKSIYRRSKKLGLKRSKELIGKDRAVRGKRKDAWSDEEIRLLKKIYPVSTKKEIKEQLKRPWSGIWGKAYAIGLRRDSDIVRQESIEGGKNAPEREDSWKPEEINLLKDLYVNNSKEDILRKIKRPWKSIRYKATKLGIKRDPDIIKSDNVIGTSKAIMAKYGVQYSTQLESMKKKSRETNLRKRGVEYPSQDPIVRKKIKSAVTEKYGVENVFMNDQIKETIKETNTKKYGTPYPLQIKKVQHKLKQTNLERYGVENTFSLIENVREGMISKYGVASALQHPECRAKLKETCLSRYGAEHPMKNPRIRKKLSEILRKPEVAEKRYKTLKDKNKFSVSQGEKILYSFLLDIDSDTLYQQLHPVYKWNIDFYMPNFDIWVQYDGTYWHGKNFKENNDRHSPQIKKIMEKDKKQKDSIPNLLRFWEDDVKKAIKDSTIKDFVLNKILEKISDYEKLGVCHQYKKKIESYNQDLKKLPFNPDSLKASDLKLSEEAFSTEIREFIEKYEWLGTVGQKPKWCFTGRYKGYLAGVILINEPNSYSKILGNSTPTYEALIQRGASSSWAPKNTSSRLVIFACKWMVQNTSKRAFIGYADPDANEKGTIYRACNFEYLGDSFGSDYLYKDPDTNKTFSAQSLQRTSSFKKWCKENNIAIEKGWIKDNGFKNLEAIPEHTIKKWRNSIQKKLSNCIKIKSIKKGKFVLVLGADKREQKTLDSMKTYKPVQYLGKPQKANISKIKPLPSPTSSRKTKAKINYIIDNHGKISRKEIAKNLCETDRWVKRQIYILRKDKKISS